MANDEYLDTLYSNKGFFIMENDEFHKHHKFDHPLAQSITRYFLSKNAKVVYDFGCGDGSYTNFFRQHGISALGFDGNPNTNKIEFCSVQDLTLDTFQLEPVDFLMTLEVCEHVPKMYEEKLLSTIDRHVKSGGMLILSWAIEGQPGLGHVNCRNNDYVIDRFNKMGYTYDSDLSNELRNSSSLFWFKNTIMCFKKN